MREHFSISSSTISQLNLNSNLNLPYHYLNYFTTQSQLCLISAKIILSLCHNYNPTTIHLIFDSGTNSP
ncbi:hypothetical protein AYI69_g2832 [Smittium culicis]|uniref:Uncharacterized protein n=1 Tax=Smittium culicis TaxID=133412 RepID=A0A1R1YLP1_9FUNG|nr:hypothetical protein AYI69_g2832 [Smittium culicis]